MSIQILLEDYTDEQLLDGKYLSKNELIDRLVKMNIELDNRVEGKAYFVELYNKLIQKYDRRMMIKSILDADFMEKIQKNLSKKRDRDSSVCSEIISIKGNFKDEQGNFIDLLLEKTALLQKQEKEKQFDEDSEVARNNQNLLTSKNLDLGNFMEKIHADLNEYKNRIRNFESDRKKSQSDKEQPRINYNDNFNYPLGDSRNLSKRPSQRNSMTNLRSVDGSLKNVPAYPYENKGETASVNRIRINLVENNNIREEVEKSAVDSSASDSDVNLDFNLKPPQNRRRNGVVMESIPSFPNVESRNSRKSLPGSSKNIQEILNKIDLKSNPTISPRLITNSNRSFIFQSFKGPNAVTFGQSQKGSNSRMNSSRQLLVSIRENPINVSEYPSQVEEDSINTLTRKQSVSLSSITHPVEVKVFSLKNISYVIFYSVIMAGICILAYFILQNSDFSKIEQKHQIFIALVLFFLFFLILLKKWKIRGFYKKTADEDYYLIKNIIINMFAAEENPLGMFESNIVRDFSIKHQISEATYKKKVFPLLKKLRDAENVIVEAEVIIQEQAQNVWKLK